MEAAKKAEPMVPTGPTVDPTTYLGGSRIAAIAGLNPYRTRLDAWAELTGRRTVEENTAMRIGKVKERPILEGVYAPEVRAELSFPGTVVVGWRGATTDAIATLPSGKTVLVEFKSVGEFTRKDWGDPALGADGVPPAVLAQVHWQADAIREGLGIELDGAHVVTEFGNALSIYPMEIDAEFGQHLIEIGRRFWDEFVIGESMPGFQEADGESAAQLLAELYPRVARKQLEPMTPKVSELAERYLAACEISKKASAGKSLLASQLKLECGDGLGFDGALARVSWSEIAGRVDWKKVADELGATEELIEKHRGEPSRQLRVTSKGEH